MTDLVVVRKGGIGNAVAEAIAAQKNVANGIAPLDADSKVPEANVRFGTAAETVAQGNDARLRTIRDEGAALTNRAILDFIGTGVTVEDDSVAGRTKVTISGVAAGAASGTVTVKDHGAVGDGVTNDSPAFQAAIDAVFGDGGGSVFVPPGRYLLQTGITVRANVKLVGVGGNKEVCEVGVSEVILMENLRSSVILCADTVTAAIRLRADGAAVEGLVFYYPNQIKPVYLWRPSVAKALGARIQPTASTDTGLYEATVAGTTAATEPTWPTTNGATVTDGGVTWTQVGTQAKSPIVYPPTVALYPENNRSATVRDCFFVNSYEAIIFTEPHNRPLIENCWIGAYKAGVRIDKSVDSPRVQNVQMMGFYDLAENVNVGQGSLDQFVKDNLTGFAFGRAAWVNAHSLFVYQANIGLHLFVGSTAGAGTARVPRGKLFGFGADAVAVGILADATDELAGFQVEGFECYVSHGQAIGIQTRELTVDTVTYRPNLRVYGLNFAGPYSRAVLHAGGWLEVSGMSFANPGTDVVVRLGTTIRTFRMSGCDFRGGSGVALAIPTGVTGKVFMSSNDLGAQTYTAPATLPSGGYKAGGNLGIPSSGW